jgi:hypothetical protein
VVSLKAQHVFVDGVSFGGEAGFLAVEAAESDLTDPPRAVVVLPLFEEFDAVATGKVVDGIEDIGVGWDEEANWVGGFWCFFFVLDLAGRNGARNNIWRLGVLVWRAIVANIQLRH